MGRWEYVIAGNPLVQYLDQQNPLSELSHRRRITSFGPGGIDPAAAPVEMRDVHPSQIGRVCLVESPEGKNCGMVSYLATYCRIDDDGFMCVPYRKVVNGIITDDVIYITPGEDKEYTLAPPDTKVNGNEILGPLVAARRGELFLEVPPEMVDLIGITPQGYFSVGSGLIPFLEHDDTSRALMGGGMMRQTLPLVRPERPRVGTGMEKIVARSSGHSITARRAGVVSRVTGNEIEITQASGEKRKYELTRFDRTNQNTIRDQRPSVREGDRVDAGQVIADGPGIDKGELALGRNILTAFLSWNGYNYEDAIIIRKGLDRQVVLYWYQSHNRVVASEYWGKIYTVLDAIQYNRTDAALIRIISPISSTVTEQDSEHAALEFAKSIFPLLIRYLPPSGYSTARENPLDHETLQESSS